MEQRFVVDHPDRISGLVLMAAFASLFRDPALTEFYRSGIAPLDDPIEAVSRENSGRQYQRRARAAPDTADGCFGAGCPFPDSLECTAAVFTFAAVDLTR